MKKRQKLKVAWLIEMGAQAQSLPDWLKWAHQLKVAWLIEGQHKPQQHRGLIRGSDKRYWCVRVLGFLQERWAGKNSKWARNLFKGNTNPNSIGVWSTDQTSAAAVCVS
jgi:hypothetical protein